MDGTAEVSRWWLGQPRSVCDGWDSRGQCVMDGTAEFSFYTPGLGLYKLEARLTDLICSILFQYRGYTFYQ